MTEARDALMTSPPSNAERIVVAMSGGVDSSVAALLLREAGHDVVGLFMRHGTAEPPSPLSLAPSYRQGCCSVDDARDARAVAAALGIPFFVVDFGAEFGRIVDAFVKSYAQGETPNPCVNCNRDLKFGALLTFARSIGASRVATGHYALLETAGGRPVLSRARDRAKDQSYVLAAVEPEALRGAMFPLGDLVKSEVRERARRAGLPVSEKRESQEICFVPSNDYRDLLRARGVGTPGPIVGPGGEQLGAHGGFEHFTVGQRRGIGVAASQPLYVTAVDPASATVTVGPASALEVSGFESDRATWFGELPNPGLEVLVQFRAHHDPVPGRVVRTRAGVQVTFLRPPRAVAPGQLAVFYDARQRVLGSCWIGRTVASGR